MRKAKIRSYNQIMNSLDGSHIAFNSTMKTMCDKGVEVKLLTKYLPSRYFIIHYKGEAQPYIYTERMFDYA